MFRSLRLWGLSPQWFCGTMAIWLFRTSITRRNLWQNRWKETKLRYFTTPETCSGTIGQIDSRSDIRGPDHSDLWSSTSNFDPKLDTELRAARFCHLESA